MGSKLFGKGYSGILMLSLSLLIALVFYPHTVLAGVTLTVNTLGQGTVTLDPSEDLYDVGAPVTVTADPDTGWMFFAFGGDFPSFEKSYTFIMNTDSWIDAIFIQPIDDSASITLEPGDTVADYRILSMPLLMKPDASTSLTNQMGAYDTTLMRMAAWNVETQLFMEYPALIVENMADPFPGDAAWFLFRLGKEFNFEGYKTPELDGPIKGKMGFLYKLANNWNMVGNPYNYPILVSSLIITTNSSEPLLLTEDLTLTQGVFWVYQNGTYDIANDAVLQPGEGGWIKVKAQNSENPELFFPSGQASGSVGNRAVIDTTGLERPPGPPGGISSLSEDGAASSGGCFISAMD